MDASFYSGVCLHALSPQSCPTLCHPMDCSAQAPLSMAFPRQEYWSGLPCSSPGIFPIQRSNPHLPASPALWEDSLPTEPPRKPDMCLVTQNCMLFIFLAISCVLDSVLNNVYLIIFQSKLICFKVQTTETQL